jgi:ferrochelatase
LSQLVVVPLYPQYALSSSESTLSRVRELLADKKIEVPVDYLEHFFDAEPYIDSVAAIVGEHRRNADKIVFSYHGLPVRHLKKLDRSGRCGDAPACCVLPEERLRFCYRAQAHHTTEAIARRLSLEAREYAISFQSRLGRDEWITPDTESVVTELAKTGVKRVAVVCPSFVADCLETLEEIAERARDLFKEHGGEDLWLIPCLNADDRWVEGFSRMVRDRARRSGRSG